MRRCLHSGHRRRSVGSLMPRGEGRGGGGGGGGAGAFCLPSFCSAEVYHHSNNYIQQIEKERKKK